MNATAAIDVAKLGTDMLQFTSSVDDLKTPDEVLDSLDKVTVENMRINVLGAALFPLRWGDWGTNGKGKTVFLHRSVPEGWWEEHVELNNKNPEIGRAHV